MPQNVPSFEWTDDALRLRQFVYEHWCEKGVGPNLRDAHEALGLDRRHIVQAYKQLQLGIICVVQEDTQNCNLIKFQPFSSFPSQVQAFVDDRFHSYIGCAMESMAVSRMPPFLGRDIRLESWCACCFDRISLTMRDGEVVTQSPGEVLIHVTSSPYDWGNIDITAMCDTMNFVIDAAHAERYERQVQRRGVLVTIDQGRMFVHGTAKHRMHNYHWPPSQMIPEIIIQGIEALGVDVTNWKG